MATHNRQSQLYRCLPLLFFAALTAWAGDIEPSGYYAYHGESFFLLAERDYAGDENALMRLEIPNGTWEAEAAADAPAEAGQEQADSPPDDDPAARDAYSGADVVLYKVPDPLAFLQKQKNLHRIQLAPAYQGDDGLANALGYAWDNLYKKSRLAWQRIFSAKARGTVVAAVPELQQAPPHSYRTHFEHNPQFQPLPGFPVVSRFRYPVWQAQPIQPPKDVAMAGSSSEFLQVRPGNVQIPLGKLTPGLYLVEAYIGRHRAIAPLFVSNTVAVAKASGRQLLVWTAQRQSGRPVAGAKILWSDGVGVLQSGSTGADGVLAIEHKSPRRSYVIGQDGEGGVFVSENFYYDSEVYGPKLYAFTDRPLYKPGDTVYVKLVGRVFRDARQAELLQAGPVKASVIDANGTPITSADFTVTPGEGGDTRFVLPEEAIPGGYTLLLDYQGARYSAAFRVARYAKPHFDVDLVLEQNQYKTGETVKGKVRLAYPGGDPVKNAEVQLSLRSQALSMVGEEARYQGRFPVKLLQDKLTSDGQGVASFELPAASQASRYILTAVASDGPTYRVSAFKEILIQPGAKAYRLEGKERVSQAGKPVEFSLAAVNDAPGKAVAWEALRLEDQSRQTGKIDGAKFSIAFAKAGSYTVQATAADGQVLGQAEHWVAGEELKTAPDTVAIVLDQDEYRPGDTAHALISFPMPVDDALITLERDQVQGHGLLSAAPDWAKLAKENPRQWRADIPIREDYSPNMTFSVLYVRDGRHAFENKGIKVAVPRVAVSFKADQAHYLPGDTVTVDVATRVDGKPVAADLAVSVVDEMVYVLQAEIAPDIGEFFYHIRRDQVRTASSLNFHSYDMAIPAGSDGPPDGSHSDRPLKMLERPRRENIDTALWLPTLKTDAQGHARFTFTMPQSLTRWRITGRASAGNWVGQGTGALVSSKDYYLTWTGPAGYRLGDEPSVALVAYNRTAQAKTAQLQADGPGLQVKRELELQPGANYLALPLKIAGDGLVRVALNSGGQTLDALETPVSAAAVGWPVQHSDNLAITAADTALTVPADAGRLRLSQSEGAARQFLRIADSLLDYPYGCVEQTASRLLPLALAFRHGKAMGFDDGLMAKLRDRIANHRLRLVKMADPDSGFGWWGDLTAADPLLTAYAYYADWQALKALGMAAPAEHWKNLLETYKNSGADLPLLHRALILRLARDMGLPVRSLAQGALELAAQPVQPETSTGPVLGDAADGTENRAIALVLLENLARQEKLGVPPAPRWDLARQSLAKSSSALAQAVLLAGREAPDAAGAAALLARIGPAEPTFERSLVLMLLEQVLQSTAPPAMAFDPGGDWTRVAGKFGDDHWQTGVPPAQAHIRLAQAPEQPLTLILDYQRREIGESQLPVRIERRLYRLRPKAQDAAAQPESEGGEEGGYEDEYQGPLFQAQPVAAPWQVGTGELYLDEIVLEPQAEAVFRYGVADVPLPPGASAENATLGMRIAGLADEPSNVMLEQSDRDNGIDAYAIPVESLQEKTVYRHLLRFGQKGRFHLPPVRYFRMYQADKQALEQPAKPRLVEVQ